MNISEDKLNSFLKQFRLLKEKHDAVAAATGERFNIFSVLDRESNEVKTHSALLAELLNRKGLHSQRVIFLKLFFAMLQRDFSQQLPDDKLIFSDSELETFEVTAEAGTDGLGRIDILVENSEKCIVIENKIYAEDQERQLGRYYDYAMKKTGSDKNVVIIYLTLWGVKPSDYTLRGDKNKKEWQHYLEKKKVLCVSYQKHIVKWLSKCMEKSVHIPKNIRWILFQYQILLKNLAGQTIHREYVMNIFSNNENYKLIPYMKKAALDFNVELECMFWESIREKLSVAIAGSEGLVNVDVIDGIESQLAKIKKITKSCLEKQNNYADYGFTVDILPEITDEAICVGILIERHAGHGKIFFGFYAHAKGSLQDTIDRKDSKHKDVISGVVKRMAEKDELDKEQSLEATPWLFGWKYYHDSGKVLDISFDKIVESDSMMQKMLCPNKRAELAGSVVAEFVRTVECFVNSMRKSQ